MENYALFKGQDPPEQMEDRVLMAETHKNEQDSPVRPSVDADEVAKFSAMASEWWDPRGKFRPLHKFNPVRLSFIRGEIETHFGLEKGQKQPFSGYKALDIGCGGGLVSEPMARLGFKMTSVDASEANIKTALTHADEAGIEIDYRTGTAEGLLEAGEGPFNVVFNLEVVEHVANPDHFLKSAADLLAPGGIMFLATLNRTPKAFALAVLGAEYILRWLPRGTHEFGKFLKPGELSAPLTASGLTCAAPIGVSYNPLSDRWRLSEDTDVNYMMVAKRPAD